MKKTIEEIREALEIVHISDYSYSANTEYRILVDAITELEQLRGENEKLKKLLDVDRYIGPIHFIDENTIKLKLKKGMTVIYE